MSWSLRGMASQPRLTLPVLVLSAPALLRTILEISSPPKRALKRQSSCLRVTQEVTNLRCRTLGFGAPGSPFEMVKDMMLSPYLYILVHFASKFSIHTLVSFFDRLSSFRMFGRRKYNRRNNRSLCAGPPLMLLWFCSLSLKRTFKKKFSNLSCLVHYSFRRQIVP